MVFSWLRWFGFENWFLMQPQDWLRLTFTLSAKRKAPDNITVIERNRPYDTFGWGLVFSDQTLGNLALADVSDAARRLMASDPRLKGGKACVNITDSTPWPEAALQDAIAEALGGS